MTTFIIIHYSCNHFARSGSPDFCPFLSFPVLWLEQPVVSISAFSVSTSSLHTSENMSHIPLQHEAFDCCPFVFSMYKLRIFLFNQWQFNISHTHMCDSPHKFHLIVKAVAHPCPSSLKHVTYPFSSIVSFSITHGVKGDITLKHCLLEGKLMLT